ncbi:ABC transporter permease [Nesterenkonia ebinurensis]|uniref:ABC transporter permease n=1 Tax=Nesterenkonia ebinurensis TaxID=2608252 RepID=UPI00123E1CCF|nr:ABC transporter permease [Nesterenkonia ebinurensis]
MLYRIATSYWARYALQIIPVLLIITFVIFFLVYIAGDPVGQRLGDNASPQQIADLREAMGLNRPFHVQYGEYMWNLVRGDFGESYMYGRDAMPIVLDRLPNTFLLGGAAMLISIAMAVPLGVLSATHKNSVLDVVVSGLAVVGKAIPNFWLGIMLILVLSVSLGLFPVSGSGSWAHLVLPAITLSGGVTAELTRVIRSNMLEVLNQDYIRTARSKGLPHQVVLYRHAFRNCLVPCITLLALTTPLVISSAIITESVFAWPGIGQLLVNAVTAADMAIVQAVVFVTALLIIAFNLAADILNKVIDPRIRFE